MAILDDIGGYLDTQLTTLTLGTNFFLGKMPEVPPNNIAAIFENAGLQPLYTQGSVNLPAFERPELQVIVRNSSYTAGRALAESMYRVLTQIANQTINGTLYYRIEALHTPEVFDRDKSGLVLFTCNFTVMRKTP